MTIPFVNQMVALRDRLAPISKEFGNPNIQSLIIRKRLGENYEYLEINPTPVVKEEFPEKEEIQKLASVEGLVKTYSVYGISRKYKEEDLKGVGVDYLINARMKLGTPVGGISCNLVSISQNFLTWDLILIERISEKNYYL